MEVELGDAELALRIGSGTDREAEAELFRRMAPRIRLYGLRHLRDPHASDDLTQQVILTTLEALRAGRLREPEKLASFVLGMCRMTVLELRRGAQRKQRLLEQFGADLLAPAAVVHCRTSTGNSSSRCVQSLKERERAVVVMTFYGEQTGADVAGFLGVSEANVRVIRHRAIRPAARMHGDGGMSCASPIDAAVLADYWLAALPGDEEEAVEEHLLGCDRCGERLREVIALAEGVRDLARRGSLRMVVSDSYLRRAAEVGLACPRVCACPAEAASSAP